LAAHGGFDVVGLEHGFEDAGEGGVDGGYGGGGGDDEDCLGLGGDISMDVCVVGVRRRTVDTMVVTRLPQRLKMAKKPMMNSAALRIKAIPKDHTIHPDTFLYVSSPFCTSSPNSFCALVPWSSHTATGSNQKLVLDAEQ
jgi:hypothetical protein